MKRLEKEHILFSYCNGKNCPKCVLRNQPWEHILSPVTNCLRFAGATDEEIDRAVELIKNGG